MKFPSIFTIYVIFVLSVSTTKDQAGGGEKGAAGFLLNNTTTTVPSCWDTI